TVMWPVLRTSNGTTPLAGIFCVGVSARAGTATKAASTATRNRCFVRVMLQPLPDLDGDFHFLLVAAALDHEDDFLAGDHPLREALQAVETVDGAALELEDTIARLQAALVGGTVAEDALDHRH